MHTSSSTAVTPKPTTLFVKPSASVERRGWLIFTLPPAEVAVHPANAVESHELYLICDDLDASIDSLTAKALGAVPPQRDSVR